jgi:hypothetical protein
VHLDAAAFEFAAQEIAMPKNEASVWR